MLQLGSNLLLLNQGLMRKVIARNSIVRPLLESLRAMIYGSGVGFFKWIPGTDGGPSHGKPHLVPCTDSRLEDWSDATELQAYFISAINQRINNANVFTRWE